MIFSESTLRGAHVIELEPNRDDRGFFARSFCAEEFLARGLNPNVAQCNISWNPARSTMRGMHYQVAPAQEAKLVRCTAGAIFDVIVDLRPGSPTQLQWIGVELTAGNHRMLFVPEGFAHGFLTLEDSTEVCYQMSEFHVADTARGFRWDDPRFGIRWPLEPAVISERDRSWQDFSLTALEELRP